ncbi:MAG: hypothetical protein EA384_07790 [Spirochaetaceae bacterium]|nr:MAG: hypothetical protein EA384_07790 [Spirochaetaceae bacterium]
MALLLVSGAATLFLLAVRRPQPVWVVSAEFAGPWRGVLAAADDAPDWPVIELHEEAFESGSARQHYGLLVTAESTVGSNGNDEPHPLVVHHHLARRAAPDGTIALALDPWLVFRRHTTEQLTYAALGGDQQPAPPERGGVLLLPGSDQRALRAWTAQLLQEAPGRFSDDIERWDAVRDRLTRGGRFQRGALTYGWEDIWPRLFGPEPAWIYAPLSRVQELPGDRTSVLEADRFPIPDHWNEYGVQARILWAKPFGMQRLRSGSRSDQDLARASEWLRSAEVQTAIAAGLRWVPAHGQARPVNPLAAAARRTWFGSSYVWEDTTRETGK